MEIFPMRKLQYISKPKMIKEVHISPLVVKLEDDDVFQVDLEETSLKY